MIIIFTEIYEVFSVKDGAFPWQNCKEDFHNI